MRKIRGKLVPEVRKACQDKFLRLRLCSGQAVVSRRYNTCSPAKRREFGRRTAHFDCKEVYLLDQHNLCGTSNYASGLKSQRIRFPLRLLDTFRLYLLEMLFFNFL